MSAQCLEIFTLHKNKMLVIYAHKHYKDGNKFTVTFQTNDIQQPSHVEKKKREKLHTFQFTFVFHNIGAS